MYRLKIYILLIVVFVAGIKAQTTAVLDTVDKRTTADQIRISYYRGGYGESNEARIDTMISNIKVTYLKGGYKTDKINKGIFDTESEFKVLSDIQPLFESIEILQEEQSIPSSNRFDKDKKVLAKNEKPISAKPESIRMTYYSNYEKLLEKFTEIELEKEKIRIHEETVEKLPVYKPSFDIYKEVVNPETKEIIRVYDFSSEQYVWDKKKQEDAQVKNIKEELSPLEKMFKSNGTKEKND